MELFRQRHQPGIFRAISGDQQPHIRDMLQSRQQMIDPFPGGQSRCRQYQRPLVQGKLAADI